jgi:hypothetical protein
MKLGDIYRHDNVTPNPTFILLFGSSDYNNCSILVYDDSGLFVDRFRVTTIGLSYRKWMVI